jgi:hemoglobin
LVQGREVKDVETYEEVVLLVKRFYDKLLIDSLIGYYFQALDLSIHIPKVADFWAFILIEKPGYKGNMIEAHARLPLKKEDFEQWLLLFHQTIDENFQGEKAELAKQSSTLIAWTMRSKL